MAFYAQSGDVARLAMDIEDAGWQFYRKLADISADEKVKSLFTYLAHQEAEHKIIFDRIRREAENEPENEYVINVISLMQTEINDLKTFVFPEHIDPSAHIDIHLALQIAIHAEEESIRIYSEIQRVFIDRFSDVLTKIVDEEKRHLALLLEFKKTLPES